jgi:long-chain fatty acid transport protein
VRAIELRGSSTRLAPTLLVLAATLVASEAQASPQDLFGYGGRTTGLAMTGASYAEGYEAVYANPAGLAPVRRRGLNLGLHGAGYQVSLDGERAALEPARGMTIGFHLPLPFGDVLQDRLVVGGGFFTPAAALMLGRVNFPEVPQWTVLDRAQVLAIQVGVGVDMHGIVDGLSFGAGVSALADVVGQLDVRLDETNAFSSVVETQLLTAFAPTLGARYTRPEWGVGLAYRHELAAHMSLAIRTADLPLELPTLTVGGVVQYDPSAIIAEGFYRPIPEVMIIANLTTRFWDAFPGAQIPTTELGRNAPAPGFSITPSPRVAVEATLRNERFAVALRGGYAYEPTPAPAARIGLRRDASGEPVPGTETPLRILDNDRHILTAGAGWTVNLGERERFTLDAYGQLHVLAPRTHEIGIDASSAPMVTDGFVIAGGWTAGLEF